MLSPFVNATKTKFSKQGQLKGSCTQENRKDFFELCQFSHEIVAPRDAASGLASGMRQHKPGHLKGNYDRSYVQWNQALCSNENLSTLQVDFYSATKIGQRGVAQGSEYLTLTIQFENVHIASVGLTGLNNKNPDLMRYELMQEITFTYQKITWTWIDGGVSASDDWENRGTA